jgi:hypothetical protein
LSEIRANTISDAAGTGAVTLTKQSAAKAWVNFNGTGTIAARDSFNVASLTDNGTGDYTVNFTSAMSDGNYAPSVSTSAAFGVAAIFNTSFANASGAEAAPTASALRSSFGDTTAYRDPNYVSQVIHGDLA